MWETDDRLTGDPVWELFPAKPPEGPKGWSWRGWALGALLVGAGCAVYLPIAIMVLGLIVAWDDLDRGRLVAQSIPDRTVGVVLSRFTLGWAFWKMGMTAFVMTFVSVGFVIAGQGREPLPGSITALLLAMLGFVASAVVTASGLLVALINGLRVWVGEGVNRARTLLLGMLLVGFTVGVLGPPLCFMARPIPAARNRELVWPFLALLVSVGMTPMVLLMILDVVGKRVIADRPTKFGPKVAAVGKWAKPIDHSEI